MQIMISLDSEAYTRKPDKGQIGKISSRIAFQKAMIELSEAADQIGNGGHTFCPAIFQDGMRRSEAFMSQQVFALDFDKGTAYEEIKTRCIRHNLEIAFSYHTFSSTPESPRFRIVFVHICPVVQRKAAEVVINLLLKLFPEADASCKDAARMFFGGKSLIEKNPDSTFQIDSLAMEVEGMIRQEAKSNSARAIKSFAGQLGIGCSNGSLGIGPFCQGDESLPKNKLLILDGEDSSFYILEHNDLHLARKGEKRAAGHKEIRTGMKEVMRQCQLFREFCNGKENDHAYKFCLLTNLQYIEGGTAEFFRIIRKYGTEESVKKWKGQFQYIKNNSYRPMKCEKGCPFSNTCHHKENLVRTLKSRERIIEKVGLDPEYDTLENVQNHIEKCLDNAIHSKRPGFYLIKAQTAIGKTHIYCRHIRDTDRPYIIAVPTSKLKREVYLKLNRMGCELPVMEWPSMDDSICPLPKTLIASIKSGFSIGAADSLRRLIKFVEDNKNSTDSEIINQVNYGKEYLNFREHLDGKSHIVMTHARLQTLSSDVLKQYQIIIDEDILMTLFHNTGNVYIEDINKLSMYGIGGQSVKRALEMKPGEYEKNPVSLGKSRLSEEKLNEMEIASDVNLFLNCSTFCRVSADMLCCFEASVLPEAKYIVMSATLNRRLYEDYFAGRYIKEYPVKTAKYQGKLIQYYYYATSRAGLEKRPEILKAVRRICGELPIITFKKYDRWGGNDYGLHIGNAIGVNSMEGKDMAVVATPHSREEIYKLIGMHLSYDISGDMKNRKIEANGYRFTLMTYQNQLLRNLQLYYIESDLEQTIGRARLLRNNCTVYLFSNYPCEQAELRGEDYLKEEMMLSQEGVSGND